MYAIIQTGGKQYRVTEGQTLKVEKLPADAGKEVKFTEVLMVADGDTRHIGTPLVPHAKVMAEVVIHGRGEKIDIIKLKRRKHHIKHMGHRQNYTEVKISGILLGETKVAPVAKVAKTKKTSAAQKARKAKKATTTKSVKAKKPAAKKTAKKAKK
jgi:large subunit ribosomal protein L21